MSFLTKLKDLVSGTPRPQNLLAVDDLDPFAYAGQTGYAGWENSVYDGGKFAGGFGETQVQQLDYWTLRARSSQLFNENHYARGIVRRLITNVINTGLTPESCPEEGVLGVTEDSLADWTDDVETRFGLWSKSPRACDWEQLSTFGAIQRAAYQEALVAGDVLVVPRMSQRTRMPSVQLISGDSVQTPLGNEAKNLRKGHDIVHGVEIDTTGRQAAFWIKQKDGAFKRLPAYGEKSGRRLAWLVYGTDKRLDEVRGVPLLSLVLQSLKEIDRYRDSAQRKAVVNSIMAMFIKKGEDKMGTLPVSGGAVRNDSVSAGDGTPRKLNTANYLPGYVPEELQQGEEPVLLGGQGTDVNFGPFEDALVSSIAWSIELPPEILKLSFSNNYSASQAAINEVKIAINLKWGDWGETFCSPIYNEWLLSEVLRGRVNATGLLDAWRDPMQYDRLAAWVAVDWYGSIKPSTDMLKQVKASDLMVAGGYSTRARESRIMAGTKYTKNIKRLTRENQQLVGALRPILELRAEFGPEEVDNVEASATALSDELDEQMDEYLEDGRREA